MQKQSLSRFLSVVVCAAIALHVLQAQAMTMTKTESQSLVQQYWRPALAAVTACTASYLIYRWMQRPYAAVVNDTRKPQPSLVVPSTSSPKAVVVEQRVVEQTIDNSPAGIQKQFETACSTCDLKQVRAVVQRHRFLQPCTHSDWVAKSEELSAENWAQQVRNVIFAGDDQFTFAKALMYEGFPIGLSGRHTSPQFAILREHTIKNPDPVKAEKIARALNVLCGDKTLQEQVWLVMNNPSHMGYGNLGVLKALEAAGANLNDVRPTLKR